MAWGLGGDREKPAGCWFNTLDTLGIKDDRSLELYGKRVHLQGISVSGSGNYRKKLSRAKVMEISTEERERDM